jgi:hypothetical protein
LGGDRRAVVHEHKVAIENGGFSAIWGHGTSFIKGNRGKPGRQKTEGGKMGDLNYYVRIIQYKTNNCEIEMGHFSESKADKVEIGANINLDHQRYYTIIIQRE